MILPQCINEIICTYIFDNRDCKNYLRAQNVDVTKYHHIYKRYKFKTTKNNKIIRKLCNVTTTILDSYVNIKQITFDHKFNQKIKKLPEGLTHLIFGYYFNQKIEIFPRDLIHLSFGNKFNQEITEFPRELVYLKFGYCFNQVIEHFPKQLAHLEFGHCFNKECKHLPNKLIFLRLGYDFSHRISKLPLNIKIYVHNKYKYLDELKKINEIKIVIKKKQKKKQY